jgi:hypothetical protein
MSAWVTTGGHGLFLLQSAFYSHPRFQQGHLRGNDESVLHGRQRDQGGAVAAGEADSRRLDIDDGLLARYAGRLVGLAASRHARPASDLSRPLQIAGRDRVDIIVGRSVRLSRLKFLKRGHRAHAARAPHSFSRLG